jgi:hypothetical protein
MIRIIISLLLVGLIVSCKKDQLNDEKSILIGNWEWEYTLHTYSFCDSDPNSTELLNPESEGTQFSMEFYEKGIVKFYQNDKLLSTDRIVVNVIGGDCGSDLPEHQSFGIKLDNKDDFEFLIYGCVNSNELVVIKGFPFNLMENEGCEIYTSYFVKE